ncbi:hypothetical protein BDZ90DRAFT_281014 [Jaminaea rosea]|uniref:Arrestin-like N-terminal domain-containing protein n=1 Tax=Jaminaea rosea TaxID=1569628 RepID=A0A316UQ95_9BASI|nr:hypothetical protein BDZ90DRAFT_281014 [Jaminaea rosea]PWN26043.1 hypothetical protein BDZ90DRAFT_281014 [Jaminaea rosea]
MSTRDRFFSSLSSAQDQLFSRLDSLQQQHFPQGAANTAGSSSSHQGVHVASQRQQREDDEENLPTYAPDQPHNAAPIPHSVLTAPPGQAQQAYDSMPRSRLENASAPDRDRRRAAEELRRHQEMLHKGGAAGGGGLTQEQRAMGLKTVHSYAAGNGKVILDIHTLPQRSPTFMGGSAERGRGALQGQAVLFTQDAERITAVRLKIKAVSSISLPRSHLPPSNDPSRRSAGPAPSGPVVLSGRSPRAEPTTAKEHLLLQLEKTLWSADSVNTGHSRSASADGRDPTSWKAGRHVFDFKIDLPSQSKDGKDLPPSFVFLADPTASGSSVPPTRAGQQGLGDSLSMAKKWVEQAGGLSTGEGEWASIKWYVKLTVERPGLFKSNERIFAPFVYLPPPSRKVQERVLPNRIRLSQQVRQNPTMPGNALAEPMASWGGSELDLNATGVTTKPGKGGLGKGKGKQSANGSGGGMWSRFLKGPALAGSSSSSLDGARWSISLPNQPSIWPLKSSLPYQICVEGGPGGLRPPILGLFLRVTLMNAGKGLLSSKNAPQSGTETRLIATGRLYGGESLRSNGSSALTQTWRGILDLPPQATPDFESPLVDTEYFIGVQKEPGSRIVWAQKILLVCNVPAVIVRRNTTATNGGTVRGVRRVPSASMRRGSAGRVNAGAGGTIRASSGKTPPPMPSKGGGAAGGKTAMAGSSSNIARRPDEAPRRPSSYAAAGPSTPAKQRLSAQQQAQASSSSSPPSRRNSPPSGTSRLPPGSSTVAAIVPPPPAHPSTSARRPDAASRRSSAASTSVMPGAGPGSASSSAVGVGTTAYPPEKVPPPPPTSSAAAPPQPEEREPTSSRSRRREHEAASQAASRSSSRAPSEAHSGSGGHTVVTDDGNDADWEFQDGDGAEGENLEDMGMDMPPSYWEAVRDGPGED